RHGDHQHDRMWRLRRAVPAYAYSPKKKSIFVERKAAGRAIQRRKGYRRTKSTGRRNNRRGIWWWAVHHVDLLEVIDVGNKKIRKAYTDQWAGRGILHPGRKMLLNNEAGGARSERVLITA